MRSRRAFRIFDALLFVLKESSYDYSVIPFTSEFYFPSIVHVYVRCCSTHTSPDLRVMYSLPLAAADGTICMPYA